MNSKIRLYAIFQFVALGSILLGLGGVTIFLYNFIDLSQGKSIDVSWSDQFKYLWSFYYNKTVSIIGSFLIYFAVFLWLANLVIGILIVRFREKNYYDYLFSMFFIFPIFSSIFCLFAQLSIKQKTIASSRITKDDLNNIAAKIEKNLLDKEVGKPPVEVVKNTTSKTVLNKATIVTAAKKRVK